MPRAPTGTVVYEPAKPGERQGRYRARVTAKNGSRPWFDLEPGPENPKAEAAARKAAAELSADVRARGLGVVPRRRTKAGEARAAAPASGETVSAWIERWGAARAARGLASAAADVGILGKWVVPRIGPLAIADVTRDDLEGVVEVLDESVRSGERSWKTAANVWGLVSKMFSDASSSKDRSLRVRADNPAAGVRGPDRGVRKSKAYLYPSEVLALMACADVPVESRRAVALSVYLYVRPGELRGLTWDAVDLEHGLAHVHTTTSREGETKPTKTKTPRRVPIEPTLLPLLESMRELAKGIGPVVQLPDDRHLARSLRAMLRRAEVQRADLHASDARRKNVTWYDLRATGISWLAIRGDDPLRIMHRAGHEDFKTTQRYIREAEPLRTGFGEVFPPLPAELLGGRKSSLNRPNVAQVPETTVEAPGIEPRLSEAILAESRRCAIDGEPSSTARDVQVPDRTSTQTLPDASPDASPTRGDPVELALAGALERAATAGEWGTVGLLARELEARRLARAAPNVHVLDAERAKREGKR